MIMFLKFHQYRYVFISLCPYLSNCRSIHLCVYFSVYVTIRLSVSLAFSSVSLAVCLSVSVSLTVSVSVSDFLSVSVTHSPSISSALLSLYHCLSPWFSIMMMVVVDIFCIFHLYIFNLRLRTVIFS